MKYNLFVHVTANTIIPNWGKPLCGFRHEDFKAGRFYHPETEIYIASTKGMRIDYQAVSHAIQVALQDEGLAVRFLRDTMPKRKRKAKKVSVLQLKIFPE